MILIGNSIPDILFDFNIITTRILECQKCSHQKSSETTPDTFLRLYLGTNATNIQSLINKTYQSEPVEDVACVNMCISKSGTSFVERKTEVEEPPNVLFLSN